MCVWVKEAGRGRPALNVGRNRGTANTGAAAGPQIWFQRVQNSHLVVTPQTPLAL
jgi:hypothetical protein